MYAYQTHIYIGMLRPLANLVIWFSGSMNWKITGNTKPNYLSTFVNLDTPFS